VDGLGVNPFGILTFIVAPAILTNASSVMALGTSNRFARAIDRARALTAEIDSGEASDPKRAVAIERLQLTERRSQLLVRSLTSFYLSVGSFAAASLVSLMGAVFFIAHHELLHEITQVIAFIAGVVGVGGLVSGSALLVTETRLTLRILRGESDRIRRATARPTA
jgi:hypothetical protein